MRSYKCLATMALAAVLLSSVQLSPAAANPNRPPEAGNFPSGPTPGNGWAYGRGNHHDDNGGPGNDGGPGNGQGGISEVPEIDATSGLAALATVSAALAFAWERRRRT